MAIWHISISPAENSLHPGGGGRCQEVAPNQSYMCICLCISLGKLSGALSDRIFHLKTFQGRGGTNCIVTAKQSFNSDSKYHHIPSPGCFLRPTPGGGGRVSNPTASWEPVSGFFFLALGSPLPMKFQELTQGRLGGGVVWKVGGGEEANPDWSSPQPFWPPESGLSRGSVRKALFLPQPRFIFELSG